MVVENTGDRPIQVGSHYHFAETNAALHFDRAAARGMRLNIASGTAVRFEPGQQRTVELVDFAGDRMVYGFRGLVGRESSDAWPTAIGQRRAYAEMFGPTVGDRVRLADTGLVIEVEDDYTLRAGGYGEEVKFGGGKTIRDGMGQSQRIARRRCADTVITNALIARPLGHRQGRHRPQGRPHRRASARPATPTCSRASTSSSARAPRSSPAKGMIVTAGGIDSHIHFICPQQIEEALASGVTTMLGGGTGPATGTFATTCTPGPWNIDAHAAGGRRLPDEPRLPRQGQRQPAARAATSRSTPARSA